MCVWCVRVQNLTPGYINELGLESRHTDSKYEALFFLFMQSSDTLHICVCVRHFHHVVLTFFLSQYKKISKYHKI